ncbi:MAG: SOS response-associated peptidase [Sphingosinicella sp.]
MCNLYRMKAPRAEVAALFGARDDPQLPLPPEELYPKREALVVVGDGGRRLAVMRWGFPLPPSGRVPITNVRNLDSPFWRTAMTRPDRRCLVPATEFCEWEGEPGSKRKCWFIVPSRPIFAFAGLWRPTSEGAAFAFLTCEPNALAGAVHPKAMPVILDEQGHEAWLSGSVEPARALASPFPSQLMSCEKEENASVS